LEAKKKTTTDKTRAVTFRSAGKEKKQHQPSQKQTNTSTETNILPNQSICKEPSGFVHVFYGLRYRLALQGSVLVREHVWKQKKIVEFEAVKPIFARSTYRNH
jgi:hypothetical protein